MGEVKTTATQRFWVGDDVIAIGHVRVPGLIRHASSVKKVFMPRVL